MTTRFEATLNAMGEREQLSEKEVNWILQNWDELDSIDQEDPNADFEGMIIDIAAAEDRAIGGWNDSGETK